MSSPQLIKETVFKVAKIALDHIGEVPAEQRPDIFDGLGYALQGIDPATADEAFKTAETMRDAQIRQQTFRGMLK